MIFFKVINQGKAIKGNNDKSDQEYKKENSWIRGYSYTFGGQVVLSGLASSGSHQVSGREYQTVQISHMVDSATPQLFKAWVENTKLDIEVHLTRSVVEGNTPHEKGYLTYKFTGAKISTISHAASDQAGQAYMEVLGFTFNQLVMNADDDSTGEKTESEDKINVA